MGKTKTKSTKNQPAKKKSSLWKKLWRFSLISAFICVVLGCSFFLFVYLGIPAPLPSSETLATIENPESSLVYDTHGKVLGKYYIYDRTTTSLDKVSPHVINALLATEDIRFYQHSGIDYRSLGRVFLRTFLMRDASGGGGSTLTQQLAKNLYPRQKFPFASLAVNKVREMIIASRMESVLSKDKILELYLNTVPFSSNVFGIEAASRKYYKKSASQLTASESAVLIGTLKASTYYHPYHHPERAEERRDVVLHQMFRAGFITGQEEEHFIAEPMVIKYTGREKSDRAAYFLDRLKLTVKDKLNETGNAEINLYTGGLKIYTTLDANMQRMAETAVSKHITKLQNVFNNHWAGKNPFLDNPSLLRKEIKKSSQYKYWKAQGKSEAELGELLRKKKPMVVYSPKGEIEVNYSVEDSVRHYLTTLHCGFLVMDPMEGEVRAWVGGVDHGYFKYDHVNKNTKRQVGSTFKPFVYATALENEVSACKYFNASQKKYEVDGVDWTPGNSGGDYDGKYTLQGALTNSVNTVSVKVLEETGIENVITQTNKMGVETEIEPYPSIALGTPSISLMEMVTAYSNFANDGRHKSPIFITKIEDKDGNVLWEQEKRNPIQTMKPETAHLMVNMLRGVVNDGTARRLRKTYQLENDIAGKTGTTQNNADGWFIGMTPGLVGGVWVGADNPSIHFRTTALGQGANMALPIYAEFLLQLNKHPQYQYLMQSEFDKLTSAERETLDCDPFKKEIDFWNILKVLAKNKKKRKLRVNENGQVEEISEEEYNNPDSTSTDTSDKKKKKGFLKRLFGKKD